MHILSICFILVFSVTFVIGKVPFDFLTPPCSVKDDVCIVGLWQNAVRNLADGREDLNIPPLDPLKLENIQIEVPGLIALSFNGLLKGFKSCIFDRARTTLKQGRFKEALDLHCNIYIKGHYDVKVNSSLLLGQEGLIKANGIGKIKLDNLFFKFLMDFFIIKDDEGTLKFVLKDGPMGYNYKIEGPVKFTSDDMYFGDQNISQILIPLLNQNWKFIMDTFGEPFFKRAMEIVGDFVRAFLDQVPASSYFIENLDSFAQKQIN